MQLTHSLRAAFSRAAFTRPSSATQQMFHALFSLAAAALLIRVIGMGNQIIVTGRFGAGAEMDAYFVAAALPILLAQLMVSAIEVSVIPAYTRARAQTSREQTSILFSTLVHLCLVCSAVLLILLLVFRRQLIYLSAPALDPQRAQLAVDIAPFISPALVFMVVLGYLECILNSEGHFGLPALAGILQPLTTAVFVLALGVSLGVRALAIGLLIGLVLQLAVFVFFLRRSGVSYRPVMHLRGPEIGIVLMAAWPVLIASLVSQASPLVDQIFASFLTAGSIAALNYALKLSSVPIGVIFASVGRAALPQLSRQADLADRGAFKETLRLYLWVVVGGTLALSAFLLVFAHPLVQLLFQRGAFTAEDADRTAYTFAGFVIGLAPLAVGWIAAKAISALGRTRALLGVTLFSIAANAIFDGIFAHFWQSFGIALSTSLVYCCTACILVLTLRRWIGPLDLLRPPPEIRRATQLALQQIARHVPHPRRGIPSVRRWRPWGGHLAIGHFAGGRVAIGGVAGGRLARWLNRPRGTPPLWVFGAILLLGLLAGLLSARGDPTIIFRVALGLPAVLLLIRYPYFLLLIWALFSMYVGSNLPLFNGKNLNTALVIPALLVIVIHPAPLRQAFRRVPALAVFCVYLAWVLCGITSSPLSTVDFLKIWLLQLAGIAIAVIVMHELTTRRRLLLMVDAMLIAGLGTALYGIYGYFTHQNGLVDPTTGDFRIISVFSFAPPLALLLSLLLPLALYRVYATHGAVRRTIALLVVLTFAVAIALTFTRGALLSIPLSVLLLSFVMPSRRVRVLLFSGAAIVGVVAVFLATVVQVPLLARFFNEDVGSLNGRTYLWQALIQNFDPLRPFGYGLGAGNDLLTRLQVGVGGQPSRDVIATSASNLFVGTLYDSGIISLVLLVVTFILLAVSLVSGIRRTRGEQRVVFVIATIVLITALLQSIEVSDLWDPPIGVYFWIIMALPFAACWGEHLPLARRKRSPRAETQAATSAHQERAAPARAGSAAGASL